jgi:outer membrane protein assembly factor BamB
VPGGVVKDRQSGQPLADVVVSDGIDVTRTSAAGDFHLAHHPDAQFVWVTVPSTHQALRPGWYADVRGGVGHPLSFDLEPRTGAVDGGCRFVQVTDLHVSVDAGARLRAMLEGGLGTPPGVQVTGEVTEAELRADLGTMVASARPEFVVATGDLADYGQREELAAYRCVIEELDVPVASVPGNHDHLSCLTPTAIQEFFADWSNQESDDADVSAAFQREVFGGDWRRPGSGRSPWLDVLGPLYYAFDWGGVHFVVYDGEGLRRYGDDYPQDHWLDAHLATVGRDTPVVVCTHFLEDADFYRSRFSGVRVVASLCGHWHGTRLYVDGETRHWTSSNAGFGGVDFTPRGYRVVTVDATGARSAWHCLDGQEPPTARVTGAATALGGRVVVARENPDVSGSVHCIDGWTSELPVAARGGVAGGAGLAFALDLCGRISALELETGATRWSVSLGDPWVRWVLGAPTVVDEVVYAGSATSVHALDAATGQTLWRTTLAPSDWAISWSGVAVHEGLAVIGAANDHLHLAALDARTGALRWRRGGRDFAGVSSTPVVAADRVFAVHVHGWLCAYRAGDGKSVWRSALDAAWPIGLAVSADLVLVLGAGGRLTAHDISRGQRRWQQPLGAGRRAARPYSRRPGGARVPLVVVDDRVWTATDDTVLALAIETGEVVYREQVGAEIATLLTADGRVLAVTTDARLVAPT